MHLNISCSPASNLNIKEGALHTVQCSLHFFSSVCTELINCIELNIAPPQWSWQGALCFCQIWHRLNNPLAFSTPVQVPIPQTISFWIVQICNTNFSSLLDSHYQNSYLYLAVWCIIFQTQARYKQIPRRQYCVLFNPVEIYCLSNIREVFSFNWKFWSQRKAVCRNPDMGWVKMIIV